jgi:hypothetical protein
MKALTSVVLLAAITGMASGCGSSHRISGATTDALQLYVTGTSSLPVGLVKEVDSIRRTQGSGHKPATLTAEVYGPASRKALVRASSGAWILESAREHKERFYLIVLHGHFVAGSHPAGTKAPQGTIETQVWSPKAGVTDTGISDRLPAAVSRLHRLTAITLS